jgi:hypothetical protein
MKWNVSKRIRVGSVKTRRLSCRTRVPVREAGMNRVQVTPAAVQHITAWRWGRGTAMIAVY